jgi:hypothetical protein
VPNQIGQAWEVPFEQYTDGQSELVSSAGQGRIRYNNATTAFEGSVNGAAYVAFAAGGVGSLDQAYDSGGAGLGREIFADAGVVDIQNNTANNTGCLLLEKVPGANQTGDVLEILVGPNADGDAIEITTTGSGVALDVNFTGIVAFGGGVEVTDNGSFPGAGNFLFAGYNANDLRTTRAIYYAENSGNAFQAAMFRGSSSGTTTSMRGLLLEDDGTGDNTQALITLQGTNNVRTGGLLRIGATGAAQLANFVEFDAANTAAVPVSAAGEGRIAYDSVSNEFVVSENGGAWAVLGDCVTLDQAYDCGGAGAGAQILVTAGAVDFDGSNGANACLLLTKASGALDANVVLDVVANLNTTGSAIRCVNEGISWAFEGRHTTASAFGGGYTTSDTGTSVGAGGVFFDCANSNAARTSGEFVQITNTGAAALGDMLSITSTGGLNQTMIRVEDNGVAAHTTGMIQFAGSNNVMTGPVIDLAMSGAANLSNYIRFGLCDTSVATVAPLQKGQIAVDSGDGLFKASRNNNPWLNMIIGNPSAGYTFNNAPVVNRTIDCAAFNINDLIQIVFTMHNDLNAFAILG